MTRALLAYLSSPLSGSCLDTIGEILPKPKIPPKCRCTRIKARSTQSYPAPRRFLNLKACQQLKEGSIHVN
ncbi:hypothetical protein GYMLUDRAFT_703744 [Collybiopsis luxurians FD-317 M1]|uniref:Uncharacterized protein n=1 Tax=Collybiopsis luxurians FD-317 M1 TaxID=944289 RepID=A0A0D0CI82_9AGAR|nr:hypothetical protein GYMLUDRAFT_703744 [Collybiopsis luxurians FD-317 M1]